MEYNTIQTSRYKPQFSGHDSFSLRHGWLEKAYEAVSENGLNRPKIFNEEDNIAQFGVGRNMVTAIRFWSHSTGVLNTVGKEVTTTRLGDFLLGQQGVDPYLENPASLWLLHWQIASEVKHTLAFWLFNHFNEQNFDRDLLTRRLKQFAQKAGWDCPAPKTLTTDISVLLSNYAVGARKSRVSDDSLGSPLSELGLIRETEKGRYSLNFSQKQSLSDSVFGYSVCEFWDKAGLQNTLSLHSLLLDPGSPGRAFMLTETELAQRLENIETITQGAIVWSETAGLRQLLRTQAFGTDWKYNILKQGFDG
ncbi:DUF4007 family protein [Ruegeria arenilitoris]|uniref:DUF4007 family protein n=1 Tax=Ruegeria arenilitoris TaxID=1173585 RepID=UPI00147D2A60|nr:DUF4007 family protein [Ruegeria arenilitoris]